MDRINARRDLGKDEKNKLKSEIRNLQNEETPSPQINKFIEYYLEHRDPSKINKAVDADLNALGKAFSEAGFPSTANITSNNEPSYNVRVLKNGFVPNYLKENPLMSPEVANRLAIQNIQRGTQRNHQEFAQKIRNMARNEDKKKALEMYYGMRGKNDFNMMIEYLNDKKGGKNKILAEEMQKPTLAPSRARGTRSVSEVIAAVNDRLDWKRKVQVRSNNRRQANRNKFRSTIPLRRAQYITANIVPIPGDGNCLFTALAQGLQLNNKRPILPDYEAVVAGLRVRQKIAKYECMLANPSIPSKPSDLKVLLTQIDGVTHCQKMARPGTYGEEIEIVAFTHIFKVPVMLFRATQKANVFQRHNMALYGKDINREPIVLLYYQGTYPHQEDAHYTLLTDVSVIGPNSHTNIPREVYSSTTGANGNIQPELPPSAIPVPIYASGGRKWWSSSRGGGRNTIESNGLIYISMTLSCVSSILRMALL